MTTKTRDALIVGATLLAIGPALVLLGRVAPSETPTAELLLPPDQAAALARARALFGTPGDVLLVAVTTASAPGPDAGRLAEVESAVASLPGVTATWSEASRPRLAIAVGEAGPTFEIARGPAATAAGDAAGGPGGAPGVTAAGRTASHGARSMLDRFLRPRGDTAVIVATLDPSATDLTGVNRFDAELGRRLAALRVPGERILAAGTPTLRAASWREARRDVLRGLPLLVLAVILVPLLFFRSPLAALFPLAMGALSSAATVVLYRLVVGAVHPWVLVLIPLVWSVATMDTLHLYEAAWRRRADGREEAVAQASRELAPPCLATALATAVSMAVLALPGSPPLLRLFGIWGAVGTVVAYGLTFVVGGPLLRLARPRRPLPDGPNRAARRALVLAQRHATPVLVVTGAALLAAGLLLPRLRVQPKAPDVFAPGGLEGGDLAALAGRLDSDLLPVELIVEAEAPSPSRSEALLSATVALGRYLETLPETRVALSAGTLIEELVASDRRALAALRRGAGAHLRDDVERLAADPRLRPWIDLRRGATRTLLLLAPTGYARKQEIIAWIDHFQRTMLEGHRLTLAGPGFVYHVAEREGLAGMGWGAAADLVLLVLILGVSLRRPRLIGAALVGNLVPVALLAGLMAALDIPWSLGLLGLPVLVLGLAVDDTVHLLWPLRRPGLPVPTGLSLAYRHYGSAVVGTSFLIAACLATLGVSGFAVNRELGLLLPAGILLALAAEIVVVPAVLRSTRRR